MKHLNKMNFLLITGSIVLGFNACGGSSTTTKNVETKEPSNTEVAVNIPVVASPEDSSVLTVLNNNKVPTYRKAEWIPGGETQASAKPSLGTSQKPSLKIVQKVESDGTNPTAWSIYDSTPAGATIASVYDSTKGSDVIELSGDGENNGFVIGYSFKNGSTWTDTVNKTIKWSMKFNGNYKIYVRLSTPNGYRYLYYTATDTNNGISNYDKPHYIHNGLGVTSKNGSWTTVTRNLTADLQRFEPSNTVTSVDGFFVRGSGSIDDVELLPTTPTIANEVIYEDAEDGEDTRWTVYDNNPTGATINNVYDTQKASKVIKLQGDGKKNGYILGAWDAQKGWKNTTNKEFSVDVKFSEDFVIYLSVITTKGHRFMTYAPRSGDKGLVVQGGYTYIHLALDTNTANGSWKTIARNLEADLKKYEPDNQLFAINAFLIRGSGCVDNIKTFDTTTSGGNPPLTGAAGGN